MRRLPFLPIAILCVLTASSVVAQSPPLTPFRGLIDHVSADQGGGGYDNAEIWHRAISGDGRYVVMSSRSSNLAAGDYDDYNGYDDIFLRDRMTGTTTRISRPSDGGSGDGLSQMGTISTNGRHVAFASGSTNLVPADTNNHWDVFVRDLDQQRTVRVSMATDGTQGDADAYYPSLSADGRFVAFVSSATTFAPGVSAWGPTQMYLHDRDADGNGIFDEAGGVTTELVSVGLTGGIADGYVDNPRISSDGRHVLFESTATNLSDDGNPNASNHLYLRDRLTGQTALIDRAMTGGPSSWGVGNRTSDMTDDGRFITFSSISHDIVWFDMNWQSQVFRYDTLAGPTATTIVSQLPDGTIGDGSSYASSVSADGRYVVFTTAASNLASPPPGESGPAMLAVRDMLDGSVARVDVLDTGEPFDQSDYYMTPAVSADGSAVVLQSRSQGALGGAYSWGASHVFVLTALTAAPESASFPMAGGSGAIEVNTSAVSGSNAVTYDPWIVLMDGGGFGAGPRTVQYLVSSNDAGIVRNGSIRIGSRVIAIHQEGDGDTTPPVITPIITGTQVNGWYTSDIVVQWTVTDPDSEIVDQSYGCTQTYTYTTDFILSTPSCEATSHGGTATVTVPLRRDTTPPDVWFNEPRPAIYPFGSIVYPYYTCYDSSSSTTTCTGPGTTSPIDTSTRGRHVFTVTATDEAGHTATKSVEYLVGVDQCVSMPAAPANLKRWLKFDGNLRDNISGLDAASSSTLFGFQAGVAGQGWSTADPWTHLWAQDAPSALAGPSGLTIAMWVKPLGWGQFNPTLKHQTLVFNPMQYHVARWNDGTLRYAFNTTNGFTWVNTGVFFWSHSWAHIVLTYDNGVVQMFLNGSLVHSQALSGTLTTGPNTAGLQIGGRSGLYNSFIGVMDDVMIFDTALPASDIDTLALSGSGSLCASFASNLAVTAPPTVTPGPYFQVTALLTDASGRPIPNRPVTITSAVSPPAFVEQHVTTDASGSALAAFPVDNEMAGGVYQDAIGAAFDGDDMFVAASAQSDITVIATPPLSWLQPANITYGTPLGPEQLRATSTLPGTFVYSPAAGTVLDAGVHMLSVTFTPTDTYYAARTRQTMLLVLKATPVVTWANPAPITERVPLGSTQLNATASVPGTFAYSPSYWALLPPGTHTLTVNFTPSDSVNYNSTSKTVTVKVKAYPVITWPTPAAITYPTTLSGGQLNATANVAGTFAYLPEPGTLLDAGTHTLYATFTPSNTADYVSESATTTIEVLKGTVTITWPELNPFTYGAMLTGLHLNAQADAEGGFTYSPPYGTILNAGTHTVTATFTPNYPNNYHPATATRELLVRKVYPSVNWQGDLAPIRYGTPLGEAQLYASSSLPGTITYNYPAGTVFNAGLYIIRATFTPEDTTNYHTVEVAKYLTVDKGIPTITWSNPAPIVYGTPLGATQLNATASVPGTLSYGQPLGTILPAGTQMLYLQFTPTDSANYYITGDDVTIVVEKRTPVITWSNPASIVYGTALTSTELNATTDVGTGTLAYSPPNGTVLSAGAGQTLTVTYEPAFGQANNYHPASATITIDVLQVTPVINWLPATGITYGTPLGATELNATSSLPGTFSYAPGAGTVLPAGTHIVTGTFAPADSMNHAGSVATRQVTVLKATAVLSWATPAAMTYGTPLSWTQLNATANVAGTFSYAPAAGTVLGAGSHTLSVSFTPDDAANYNGSSASVTLNVAKAATSVTWSNPADVVYGTALGGSQLSATANVAGTFSYAPAAGTVLSAGSQTLAVTFTPDDAANHNGSSASVTLNVTKAATSVTWSNPADIGYGAALGAAQLDATASVAGTFSYSPAAGTVLGAGTHSLAVTFTPDDAVNYATATANVSIAVGKATPVITWATPAGITYGTGLSGTQLNATANVNGSFVYTVPAAGELGAGTHDLSVMFMPADGANYTTASRSVSIVVAPVTLTVRADNAGKVYGQALPSFTATGTGFVNGDSMSSLGGALAFATGATATSAPGSYSVTPTGVSSANYAITFAAGTLTVNKASTSVTLTTTPNPSNNNQTVQLRAVVSAVAPGAGTATGTVEFRDNGTLLGTATLVNGVATMNKNFKRGTHPLTATYAGSTNFTGSSGSRTHQTQ